MSYLFVDAAYLRPLVSEWAAEWFGDPDLELDPLRLGWGHLKCFYYDCAPEQQHEESQEQFAARSERATNYVRRIKRTDGWHVYEGTLRRRQRKLTQKEVDVAIAVDLLTHTHRKNTDRMALIAGDLDFRPVVDAVVREGMYLHLVHGTRASQELMDAADARTEISPFVLHSWMSQDFQRAYPMPGASYSPTAPSYGAAVDLEWGYCDDTVMARLCRHPDGGDFVAAATQPDPQAQKEYPYLSVSSPNRTHAKLTFEWYSKKKLHWVQAGDGDAR